MSFKFLQKIYLLCAFLILPFHLISQERVNYTKEGLIQEAYVTYATENYFPLVEVLLDSVKAFSSRPIVVFGVNADVPFSTEKYPFMIKKRIDIESSSKENVFFTKPRVFLESKICNGVYVDSDIILNKGADILFEHCNFIYAFPLAPLFPGEVNNQKDLMDALGIKKKSMPYVHAPLIIFNSSTFAFMHEWREHNVKYGHLAKCHDETILNVLLWKHKVKNAYINLCDPYYALAYDYLSGGTSQHQIHGYKNWVGKIDFYTFHGCKDAYEAKKILNLLIIKAKTP